MLPFHTVAAIANFPLKSLLALRGDSIRERLYFPSWPADLSRRAATFGGCYHRRVDWASRETRLRWALEIVHNGEAAANSDPVPKRPPNTRPLTQVTLQG